jgi:hypothetical protein
MAENQEPFEFTPGGILEFQHDYVLSAAVNQPGFKEPVRFMPLSIIGFPAPPVYSSVDHFCIFAGCRPLVGFGELSDSSDSTSDVGSIVMDQDDETVALDLSNFSDSSDSIDMDPEMICWLDFLDH